MKLTLTYSEANKCYVKSLGHWFTTDGTKRIPRFFRFTYSNTSEGRRQAELELMPLLLQWQSIKTEAKKRGDKHPVWHRPILAKIEKPTLMQLSSVTEESEATDKSEATNFRARAKKREKLLVLAKNLAANEQADPLKPLPKATVQQAKDAYCAWYETTGVKTGTSKMVSLTLNTVLAGMDTTQPMMQFGVTTVVDSLIGRVASKDMRARTARTYSNVIKAWVEWYAKQVKEYPLPEDWRDLFKARRFRNPADDDVVYSEDAEESDFEVFSASDLKVLFEKCNTDRQRLYCLLALQGGMYFVDIAFALRTKNIHLDREKPFLLYRREKESHHPNPIIQKVWLWEETSVLLRREMNTGTKYSHALLSDEGEPLTKRAVEKTWWRVKGRAEKSLRTTRGSVRFTDLRKTGGSAIANLSSSDIGNLHLGHKVQGIGSKYIKIQKKRLYRPMMAWRDQLLTVGAFDSFK